MDVFFAFPGRAARARHRGGARADPDNVILAIAIVYTPIFARVVRGPVLALKEREFVEAARALGARAVADRRPARAARTCSSVLVVQASIALSWAVLTEASLSFLGLSAQPPTPSWGVMLNEGRQNLELAPHLAIFPGLAIMLAVLGFNLLGDGLRDVLDPRLRQMIRPRIAPAICPLLARLMAESALLRRYRTTYEGALACAGRRRSRTVTSMLVVGRTAGRASPG